MRELEKKLKRIDYSVDQIILFAYVTAMVVFLSLPLFALTGVQVLYQVATRFTALFIGLLLVKPFKSKKYGYISISKPLIGKRARINQCTFGEKGWKKSSSWRRDFAKSMIEFKKNAPDQYEYVTFTHEEIVKQINKNFNVTNLQYIEERSLLLEKILLRLAYRDFSKLSWNELKKKEKYYIISFTK